MAAQSKAEYLKKYMSEAELGSKKKKRKKKEKDSILKKSRVKIVDDDVDMRSLLPSTLNNALEDDIQVEEDLPIVAAFVDERPEDVINLEKFRSDKRWKRLQRDEGKSRLEADTSATKRQRHDSSDESPVRDSSSHYDRQDAAPARHKRHDSDFDDSPLRGNTRRDSDSDQSPPRTQKRHDSDFDQSPPRTQRRYDSDSDQSPPRTQRRPDSESDQSPPRRQKGHDSDSDQSPPRRQKGHGSDSDQSPPRRRRGHGSDSDQSPPRKQTRHGSDSDQSPLRRKKRLDSGSDLSPPRRSKHSAKVDKSKSSYKTQESASQSKRRHKDGGTRWSQAEDKDDKGRSKKTLGGAKAGLSSAKEMKDEMSKLRKKEDDAFHKIDDKMLGKNAQTVFRDKSGRRRNMAAEAAEKEQEEAEKAEKAKKYQEWGRGLKQVQQQDQALQDALHEVDKPLARYRNDQDLDAMLREQEREGDPMLAYMKKKKSKEQPAGKKKEIPRYKGQPPPNRFNIWPGYRWDGVDRSNGFEKNFFQKRNEKKARQEEAYKWSTEDM